MTGLRLSRGVNLVELEKDLGVGISGYQREKIKFSGQKWPSGP